MFKIIATTILSVYLYLPSAQAQAAACIPFARISDHSAEMHLRIEPGQTIHICAKASQGGAFMTSVSVSKPNFGNRFPKSFLSKFNLTVVDLNNGVVAYHKANDFSYYLSNQIVTGDQLLITVSLSSDARIGADIGIYGTGVVAP